MDHRFLQTLTFLAALALPALALAHGDEDHSAQSKTLPSKQSSQHGAQGTGHAATLGKPAPLNATGKTVQIEMGDTMRFKPESISIKRGETIRFVVRNQGQLKHEMVLGTLAELKEHAAMMARFPEMEHDDPNAVSVEPGKTGELAWIFTKAGNFHFACLVAGHFEAGMKGRIVVKQ